MKPGYKTTEGLLSLLALTLSTLVALKWVPVTVSATLQADAVKAVPFITAGYAIARGLAKHGARPGLLPRVESVAAEILPAAPAATPTVAVSGWPTPPPFQPDPNLITYIEGQGKSVPPAPPPAAPDITDEAIKLIQS